MLPTAAFHHLHLNRVDPHAAIKFLELEATILPSTILDPEDNSAGYFAFRKRSQCLGGIIQPVGTSHRRF